MSVVRTYLLGVPTYITTALLQETEVRSSTSVHIISVGEQVPEDGEQTGKRDNGNVIVTEPAPGRMLEGQTTDDSSKSFLISPYALEQFFIIPNTTCMWFLN